MKKWLSLTPRYRTSDCIELSLYSLTGLRIDSELTFTVCYVPWLVAVSMAC